MHWGYFCQVFLTFWCSYMLVFWWNVVKSKCKAGIWRFSVLVNVILLSEATCSCWEEGNSSVIIKSSKVNWNFTNCFLGMWKVTLRNNDDSIRLFSWAPAQQDVGRWGNQPPLMQVLWAVWRAGPVRLTTYKYPWSPGAQVESICSLFANPSNKLSTMRPVLCLLLVVLAVCCYEGEYHLWSIQSKFLESWPLWTVGKFMCDKVEVRKRQSKASPNLFF